MHLESLPLGLPRGPIASLGRLFPFLVMVRNLDGIRESVTDVKQLSISAPDRDLLPGHAPFSVFTFFQTYVSSKCMVELSLVEATQSAP